MGRRDSRSRNKEALAAFAASLLSGFVGARGQRQRREEDKAFRKEELDARRAERGEDRDFRKRGLDIEDARAKETERHNRAVELARGEGGGGFNVWDSNASATQWSGIDHLVKQGLEAGLDPEAIVEMARKPGAKTVKIPKGLLSAQEVGSLQQDFPELKVGEDGRIELSPGLLARIAGDRAIDPAVSDELTRLGKGFQSEMERAGLSENAIRSFIEHRRGSGQQRPRGRPGDPIMPAGVDATPPMPQTREEATKLEVNQLLVGYMSLEEPMQSLAHRRLGEMGFPLPPPPAVIAAQVRQMQAQQMQAGQHPADAIMAGQRPSQGTRGSMQQGPMRPGARGGPGEGDGRQQPASRPASRPSEEPPEPQQAEAAAPGRVEMSGDEPRKLHARPRNKLRLDELRSRKQRVDPQYWREEDERELRELEEAEPPYKSVEGTAKKKREFKPPSYEGNPYLKGRDEKKVKPLGERGTEVLPGGRSERKATKADVIEGQLRELKERLLKVDPDLWTEEDEKLLKKLEADLLEEQIMSRK